MTDKEWTEFFRLLTKIVDGDGSVREKIDTVKEKAAEEGDEAEMNLDEFTSWDFGE